jgi:membrane protein required for colicin V production
MIFDALLLVFGLLAFWRGWQKGLLWAILSLVAVLAGVLIAMQGAHQLSEWLFRQDILNGKYTLPLSFVIIFVLVILLFRLLVRFAEGVLEKMLLGWANRLAGGTLYLFFVCLLFSAFAWLAQRSGLFADNLEKESRTMHLIAPLGPKTVEYASALMPVGKDLYREISGWEEDKPAAAEGDAVAE